MKTILTLTGAVLLLSAVTSKAITAEPAATITFPLPAGNTFMAPALVKPQLDCRKPATVGGLTITFTGAAWTAGAFSTGIMGPSHYVEIISGPSEGCWADIVANTSSTLTLATSLSGYTTADDFVIRKHVTLDQLSGFSAFSDIVRLPSMPSFAGPEYITDGIDWYDANTFTITPGVPIPPCQTLMAVMSSPATVSFAGRVRQTKICCPLQTGWNLVPQPAKPIGASFGSWTLGTSLLSTTATPLAMVIANFSIPPGPIAVIFPPAPWAPAGSAATVLTAGNVAYVFTMPPAKKWCR